MSLNIAAPFFHSGYTNYLFIWSATWCSVNPLCFTWILCLPAPNNKNTHHSSLKLYPFQEDATSDVCIRESRAAPQEQTRRELRSHLRLWPHQQDPVPHGLKTAVLVMGSINRHRQAINGPGPGSFQGIQPGAKADRARDQAEEKAASQGRITRPKSIQETGPETRLHTASIQGVQETTYFYNTVLRSIHNAGPEAGLEMHTQNETQAVTHLALPCTLNVLYAADRPPDSDISLLMGNLLHTFLIL